MNVEVNKKSVAVNVSTKQNSVNPSASAVLVKKGYSPKVIEGIWWEYDDTLKDYVSTGIRAQGAKGEKGDTGKGTKGDKGEPGKPFTYADFTPEQLASLKGEKGDDGEPGSNGSDGISATHSWDGTTLVITSASGTSSADLKGEKGDKGEPGTAEGAMKYCILTFNGSAFLRDGVAQNFAQLKALCLDEEHFVYAQYSNRLYIPQYVSNSNIFFQATYIQSDAPQIHRISINSQNAVSQYNYNLAKATDIPTVPTDEISANTSARHTHSNKSILDAITKAPITEHQSLADYVKTNDARLSDARTPKTHTHTKSEIADFPTTFPPAEHNHNKLRSTEYEASLNFYQDGLRYLDAEDVWHYVAFKENIPTDEHINSLIDSKLGVIENGTY